MLQAEKEKNFWEFIKFLNKENVLKDVVLIGSWVEKFYEQKYGYKTLSFTNDIDIYYKETSIYLKDKVINISEEMKNQGYEEIRDYFTNVIRYKKDDFEIEFLTLLKGDGSKSIRKIESLGINTEALRYLDILDDYSITININDCKINIPEPSAYVLHKMIINHNRKPIEKKDKDIEKIKNLIYYIMDDDNESNRFKEIYSLINNKYRKTKKYIDNLCIENNICINEILNKNNNNCSVDEMKTNSIINNSIDNSIDNKKNKIIKNNEDDGRK